MSLFTNFHKNNLNVSRINYAVICLLPKCNDAIRIKQYRPISLLNCSYKIITKVLTVMLALKIAKIIDKVQTGFIKGRNILVGVAITHEILKGCKGNQEEGILFKIDVEKAYDSIEWSFLLKF